MIEEARKIIKRRLFTTVKDYNALPDGIEFLAQAAKENRQKLSPEQRQKAIDRLQTKLDVAIGKTVERMRLGRSRGGGSAGALNRDVHNLGFNSDEIERKIRILKNNK
ncbi:MAG: hypothetical protein LBT43_07480 [Prevotella sp.]|jgi:hypothetical protein|nr:hypothetical protein [Prevotella sp.]